LKGISNFVVQQTKLKMRIIVTNTPDTITLSSEDKRVANPDTTTDWSSLKKEEEEIIVEEPRRQKKEEKIVQSWKRR